MPCRRPCRRPHGTTASRPASSLTSRATATSRPSRRSRLPSDLDRPRYVRWRAGDAERGRKARTPRADTSQRSPSDRSGRRSKRRTLKRAFRRWKTVSLRDEELPRVRDEHRHDSAAGQARRDEPARRAVRARLHLRERELGLAVDDRHARRKVLRAAGRDVTDADAANEIQRERVDPVELWTNGHDYFFLCEAS